MSKSLPTTSRLLKTSGSDIAERAKPYESIRYSNFITIREKRAIVTDILVFSVP